MTWVWLIIQLAFWLTLMTLTISAVVFVIVAPPIIVARALWKRYA